jgi:hypothetical protein
MNEEANANANSLKMLAKLQNRLRRGGMLGKRMKLWVMCNRAGTRYRVICFGAMLIHPRPKILGCCIPWTKCPLAVLPLTEPSHPFDWIERSDTHLPTAARFSAAKRWSSMCGPSVHPTEGRQSNKPGQGRRRSRPDAPLIC